MCFSATASFVASVALIGGGAVAIRHFRYSKRALGLVVIPLVFGVHQFSEGLVWLGINGTITADVQQAAMYFFSFIALCFWPVFIPLSMLCYEYPQKRWQFQGLLVAGSLLSLYLFWSFVFYSELSIDVQCCNSLAYSYAVPWGHNFIDGAYVFIVVVPMLLSSNPRIRYLLGPGFFLTFLIALVIQSGRDYPSIWCFLAAMLSILNYYALARRTEGRPTSSAGYFAMGAKLQNKLHTK